MTNYAGQYEATADDFIQSILTAVQRISSHPDKDTWGITLALREVDDLIWTILEDEEN